MEKPVVTKNQRAGRIEFGNVETKRSDDSVRQLDWQLNSSSDDAVRGSIEKSENNRRHGVGIEKLLSKMLVNETMSRTRVHQCGDRRGSGERELGTSDGDKQGFRIGKSGSVETKLLGCTGRFNATLGPCGATRVAQAFDAELCGVAELAVVAERALA